MMVGKFLLSYKKSPLIGALLGSGRLGFSQNGGSHF